MREGWAEVQTGGTRKEWERVVGPVQLWVGEDAEDRYIWEARLAEDQEFATGDKLEGDESDALDSAMVEAECWARDFAGDLAIALADPSVRPETGPMVFGGDWRGVFFRGDVAYQMAATLRAYLEGDTNEIGKAVLAGLAETLDRSHHFAHDEEVQQMRAFGACLALDEG